MIWLYEQGKKITSEVAMSKLFASQMAVRTALDAVQIHGGYGYISEFPVERYLRDAKICEIGGGTSEMQMRIIARELMRGA